MEEADRLVKCEYLVEQAMRGEIQIWTSSLSHAEVFKIKCAGDQKQLQADQDR